MASKVLYPVNPEVVRWARKAMTYKEEDAAKKIGINIETLKAWEDGTGKPTYRQLRKMGTVYKRVTPVFFLASPPKDSKIPKDFRTVDSKKKTELLPDSIARIRDAERKRVDAIELATMANIEIQTFQFSETINSNVQEVSRKYRKVLGVTIDDQKAASEFNSFKLWKTAIESLGVLVFQDSFKSIEELRALAIFYSEYPLILLNTKDEYKPRTFSLLHEFCHLLLHVSGIGDFSSSAIDPTETFCNAFAGNILVPKEFLLEDAEVKSIKDEDDVSEFIVGRLSNRYSVSWEVILRRLLDLGKVTQPFYENTKAGWKRQFARPLKNKKREKGGPSHYVLKNSYNGEVFTRLALVNYGNRKITERDLSHYLDMNLSGISKLYPSYFSGVN